MIAKLLRLQAAKKPKHPKVKAHVCYYTKTKLALSPAQGSRKESLDCHAECRTHITSTSTCRKFLDPKSDHTHTLTRCLAPSKQVMTADLALVQAGCAKLRRLRFLDVCTAPRQIVERYIEHVLLRFCSVVFSTASLTLCPSFLAPLSLLSDPLRTRCLTQTGASEPRPDPFLVYLRLSPLRPLRPGVMAMSRVSIILPTTALGALLVPLRLYPAPSQNFPGSLGVRVSLPCPRPPFPLTRCPDRFVAVAAITLGNFSLLYPALLMAAVALANLFVLPCPAPMDAKALANFARLPVQALSSWPH